MTPEQQVEDLLPCTCGSISMGNWCPVSCPAHYRPAVATVIAELRKNNDFLVEAIDAAIKDRDYFERLARSK